MEPRWEPENVTIKKTITKHRKMHPEIIVKKGRRMEKATIQPWTFIIDLGPPWPGICTGGKEFKGESRTNRVGKEVV